MKGASEGALTVKKEQKPQTDVLLTDELLELPDGKLGLALWATWVAYQLGKHRIPLHPIPDDIFRSIRAGTIGMDTDKSRLAGFEKAVQRIAKGDIAGGEKLFRDWKLNEAKIAHGLKFKPKGRGPGPIRKAIAKLLKANSTIKNPEIWAALKNKPPRGWEFRDNSQGKYIEGPDMANMNYARFCNVCSEVRDKGKTRKFTG